ncbi:HAMP domain-containing sensor histidine kinase [Clostridium aestuarii]|uniref:histidine kinase n=1 Tax=Clostridium aestuarii TaxID=338193 RepID=A0ABT4D160_9CLOT|nr:HAMP domain-containing sensor histidine kinase [Clostridium aestuarii]MCY6484980.1 HAMP domain-containing sensor histidine kinase [Clostridium aestuarii]
MLIKKKSKITAKLIKYFLVIMMSVVSVSFIVNNIFLSRFYMNQQYRNLKVASEQIYDSIKNDSFYENMEINAVLVTNNSVVPLTKGKRGMLSNIGKHYLSDLKEKGIISNPRGDKYIYYRLKTDMGNIVVFKDNKDSSEYLKAIYLTLIFVFLLSVIVSVPLISYFGSKITKPILKLQSASKKIADGNFKVDLNVNTKDEIEELSLSLNDMSQKLEKKSTLQREFIANVSHDFKTPLSIIRNLAEVIRDGLVDEQKSVEYSDDIIKQTDKLNLIVIDILKLSKLQDGKLKPDLLTFNLKDFLEKCKNNFTSLAEKKNVKLVLNSINLDVTADSNMLFRVLHNLIDNAIKFSNENGKVEIISLNVSDGVKISVKDYGIGIEKDMINDIWDRYYKNSKSGGMGLGLPICKEILELHNFKYGVESYVNEFTEFYFIISK